MGSGEWDNPVVRAYIKDVGRTKCLSPDETRALFVEYRSPNTPKGRKIAIEQILWTANLRLVVHYVSHSRRIPPPSILDAIQLGNEGLRQAIVKYKPSKQTTFGTYARYWIRAYALRVCGPRLTESLDEILDGESPQQHDANLCHYSTPEDEYIAAEQKHNKIVTTHKAVAFVVAHTRDKRARAIIQARLLSDEQKPSLTSLGTKLHASRERIRQIETKAIHGIRRYVKLVLPR